MKKVETDNLEDNLLRYLTLFNSTKEEIDHRQMEELAIYANSIVNSLFFDGILEFLLNSVIYNDLVDLFNGE